VSGMVPCSSLIPRPAVFHDPDFVNNYCQNNENKTFPAAGIYIKLLRSWLPGFFFFALIVPAAVRLSTTNFYWQSHVSVSLTVSDVLKYLAPDKCNE